MGAVKIVSKKIRNSARKRKTLAQEVEAAAVLLQRLVRLKASDDTGYAVCVTCDSTCHYKEMDGGHFISRNHKPTKLLEENVHPQCKGCNGFKMKDSLTVLRYRNWMVDMYGEKGVNDLESLAYQTKKFTREELADLVADFKEQIKYHEERIG